MTIRKYIKIEEYIATTTKREKILGEWSPIYTPLTNY